MLIAHVTFSVSEKFRTEALTILKQEVETVRKMNGCIMFTPFSDPTNDSDIGVLHEWVDAKDFSAYLDSESFKLIGQVLRPMMIAPPSSKRFNANLIEN